MALNTPSSCRDHHLGHLAASCSSHPLLHTEAAAVDADLLRTHGALMERYLTDHHLKLPSDKVRKTMGQRPWESFQRVCPKT